MFNQKRVRLPAAVPTSSTTGLEARFVPRAASCAATTSCKLQFKGRLSAWFITEEILWTLEDLLIIGAAALILQRMHHGRFLHHQRRSSPGYPQACPADMLPSGPLASDSRRRHIVCRALELPPLESTAKAAMSVYELLGQIFDSASVVAMLERSVDSFSTSAFQSWSFLVTRAYASLTFPNVTASTQHPFADSSELANSRASPMFRNMAKVFSRSCSKPCGCCSRSCSKPRVCLGHAEMTPQHVAAWGFHLRYA